MVSARVCNALKTKIYSHHSIISLCLIAIMCAVSFWFVFMTHCRSLFFFIKRLKFSCSMRKIGKEHDCAPAVNKCNLLSRARTLSAFFQELSVQINLCKVNKLCNDVYYVWRWPKESWQSIQPKHRLELNEYTLAYGRKRVNEWMSERGIKTTHKIKWTS